MEENMFEPQEMDFSIEETDEVSPLASTGPGDGGGGGCGGCAIVCCVRIFCK